LSGGGPRVSSAGGFASSRGSDRNDNLMLPMAPLLERDRARVSEGFDTRKSNALDNAVLSHI
jgi:hypothetical protein